MTVFTPGQWLAVRLGLVKPNFQGTEIPAASGLTFLLLAPVSLALGGGIPVAVASVLGLLGFLDDRFGDRSDGEAPALAWLDELAQKARDKCIALIKLLEEHGHRLERPYAAYLRDGFTPGFLIDAPLIALSANALNLLDLRPGRACFGFALLAVPSLIARPPGVGLAVPLLGFLVEWPFDARARAMLGDTGSNFLGALAGALAMESLPLWGRAALLFFLIALNLAAERVSINRVIARTFWLDRLDRRLGVRAAALDTGEVSCVQSTEDS